MKRGFEIIMTVSFIVKLFYIFLTYCSYCSIYCKESLFHRGAYILTLSTYIIVSVVTWNPETNLY